jgi:hypothetical protein
LGFVRRRVLIGEISCEIFRPNIMKKCPIKIGGHGIIVEIDECQLGQRKANVGRLVPERWIFGGIERDSRRLFLVPLKTEQQILF